jgi:hypothetical protein
MVLCCRLVGQSSDMLWTGSRPASPVLVCWVLVGQSSGLMLWTGGSYCGLAAGKSGQSSDILWPGSGPVQC